MSQIDLGKTYYVYTGYRYMKKKTSSEVEPSIFFQLFGK